MNSIHLPLPHRFPSTAATLSLFPRQARVRTAKFTRSDLPMAVHKERSAGEWSNAFSANQTHPHRMLSITGQKRH